MDDVSDIGEGTDVGDSSASSLTAGKRDSSPCSSPVASANGLATVLRIVTGLSPDCSVCFLLSEATGTSPVNALSSASVKFPFSFFGILLCFLCYYYGQSMHC